MNLKNKLLNYFINYFHIVILYRLIYYLKIKFPVLYSIPLYQFIWSIFSILIGISDLIFYINKEKILNDTKLLKNNKLNINSLSYLNPVNFINLCYCKYIVYLDPYYLNIVEKYETSHSYIGGISCYISFLLYIYNLDGYNFYIVSIFSHIVNYLFYLYILINSYINIEYKIIGIITIVGIIIPIIIIL